MVPMLCFAYESKQGLRIMASHFDSGGTGMALVATDSSNPMH